MDLFDEIKTGLNEAIEFEKGNIDAKQSTISATLTDKAKSEAADEQ